MSLSPIILSVTPKKGLSTSDLTMGNSFPDGFEAIVSDTPFVETNV